jgi:hypothetical protein
MCVPKALAILPENGILVQTNAQVCPTTRWSLRLERSYGSWICGIAKMAKRKQLSKQLQSLLYRGSRLVGSIRIRCKSGGATLHATRRVATRRDIQYTMSGPDMMDIEPITASMVSKGKGRADNTPMDKDHLPWCVLISHTRCNSWNFAGSKSIDQSL